MNASAAPRTFTVEEANQRLPLVRMIVQDIVELYRDVHDRRSRLERVRQRKRPVRGPERPKDLYSEEFQQMETDLDRDIDRLDAFVKELSDLDVQLKDPVSGHVDFRGIVDNADVCLCWKSGEEDIGYWHALGAGIESRQSLVQDSISE